MCQIHQRGTRKTITWQRQAALQKGGDIHTDCMSVDGNCAVLCETDTDNKKTLLLLSKFLGHCKGVREDLHVKGGFLTMSVRT